MSKPVVVLGMHRAGTSLAMNVLYELGVHLGPGLIDADEWNPGGYWEMEAIHRTHDAILDKLNRRWNDPSGVLPYPGQWWRDVEIEPLKRELAEIARKGIASAVCSWGFKDPRAASLLPLWQEVFENLEARPRYVLALRHPRSVVASLARRDGLVDLHSQLLWLRCYLDALRHANGRIEVILEYEQWFRDSDAQIARLMSVLDENCVEPSSAREKIVELVRPELCHHACDDDAGLEQAVTELYGFLQAAAERGGPLEQAKTVEHLHQATRGLCEAWAANPAIPSLATVPGTAVAT